ncbi:hypothetical protein R3P38DRAFT_2811970 [Favolaschia claudopus]|uniref:SWIM-type domain-containing protein n=1 Tax=Favolaschia claudopus TaxID=2862362 RepID=A0AAV9Z8Q9_9AGAR
MDHLISTLITQVVPYYSLKQRRQKWGFEGIDIEVKKRQDITKKSQSYTVDQIEHVEGSHYLVQSQSKPSDAYEVDLDSYTCSCFDFPLISYCKHICAVQTLFKDDTPVVKDVFGAKSIPTPSPISESEPDSPISHDSELPTFAPAPQPPKSRLERLAGRLRRPRTKESDLPSLSDFNQLLDDMLKATDTDSVLPAAQHVPTSTNEWRKTQTAMGILPKAKTRAKKDDSTRDASYGGGAKSGSKAAPSKKPKKNSYVAQASMPTTVVASTQPPLTLPTPYALPNTAPTYYYPNHYYYPPSYMYPTAPMP